MTKKNKNHLPPVVSSYADNLSLIAESPICKICIHLNAMGCVIIIVLIRLYIEDEHNHCDYTHLAWKINTLFCIALQMFQKESNTRNMINMSNLIQFILFM